MLLSLAKRFPLGYFGFPCSQVSSVSKFHSDTGGKGGHLFKLTCSVVLQGGGSTANKRHWRVRGVQAESGPHWVCPRSRCVCFPRLHCSGSWLLCRELSKLGIELRALPRPKPLRLRFSGAPQRRRLGWACVLCLSQVPAAQVTRCLVGALSPGEAVHLIISPSQSLGFLGAQRKCHLRCAVCLLWGADLWLQPS